MENVVSNTYYLDDAKMTGMDSIVRVITMGDFVIKK